MDDKDSKLSKPEVIAGDWEDEQKSELEGELKIREAKFIEGLGKFGLESQALEFAGYKPTDSKAAWRLKQRSRVKFAIEQMKSQALEQAVLGRVQLIEQTKQLLDEARTSKQYTAVRGLNQDLAVLCGFGFRTGEIEAAAPGKSSEADIVRALFEGRMRVGVGYREWERGDLQRIIAEYEKATGFVIPRGEFSEAVAEAVGQNPTGDYLKMCKGCGRALSAEAYASSK